MDFFCVLKDVINARLTSWIRSSENSSANINDMKVVVEMLMRRRIDEQYELNAAKDAGQVETMIASNWFQTVDYIIMEADAIEVEYKHQGWVNFRSRYKLSKRSIELMQKAEVILKDQFVLACPPLGIERQTEPIENQPSAQHMLPQLLDRIVESKIGILGIYGMGGVGKTTLAKNVNNHFTNNNYFEIVIMVTVSAAPNIRSIQTTIGRRFNLDLSNTTEDQATKLLYPCLSRKKFLIILDDVWDEDIVKLEDVGIPNPQNHEGSKVLITSRSQHTCKRMGVREPIKVQALSYAESWNLFVEKAGEHVTANEIRCFAEKIVQRCEGLPLTIIIVAGAMANQYGVEEWANAEREMKKLVTDIQGNVHSDWLSRRKHLLPPGADEKQLEVVEDGTVERFIGNIEEEKLKRFSPQELARFTQAYSIKLGSGGFGVVYKGQLPNNGIMLAVKVLNDIVSKTVIENQFMAEVSTIGRTYHKNLARLHGFCYDSKLKALVYEYLENGSLDRILYAEDKKISWLKLYEIALGVAEGLVHLHEGCKPMIIHYDIKPGNILLDSNFCPKVADFGLAKFCNGESHVSMSGFRGTLGYAAPELSMPPFSVTYKCDVYSFGMMLFEMVGWRRNQSGSQQWFPRQVWDKFESGELSEMIKMDCKIDEVDKDKAEVMCIVALWCVQYQPKERPSMGSVLQILLEGGTQIQRPQNPFPHFISSGMEVTVSIDRGMDSSRGGSDFTTSSGGVLSQFTEN